MITRRDILRSFPVVSLSATVPGFLARTARAATPEKDGRVLVVIQLDGGNDGINTVVPYHDEGYAKHRKVLRLSADRLLKIGDGVGLHPSMRGAAKLLETGRLAIVQGVGYPNPNRSHFASMAIWQTARFDPEEQSGAGWLGRGFDESGGKSGQASSLYIGSGAPPVALRGRRSATASLERIDDLTLDAGVPSGSRPSPGTEAQGSVAAFVRRSALDAYATAERMAALKNSRQAGAEYPGTDLGEKLSLIAQLLKGGLGARVFYTSQSGYDTHAGQAPAHASLLSELAGGLLAFLDDLAAAKLADRVAVLCFSEFGRRVAENGSGGTDHGTAAPVFLAGPGVKAGVIGRAPSLLDLQDGDLKFGVDFRRIYAGVLENWLGIPAKSALGGEFDPMPLFREFYQYGNLDVGIKDGAIVAVRVRERN
jgi:uncharacterized protein (DUF1501 family)